jgi:Ca-activated chloride channel family protein
VNKEAPMKRAATALFLLLLAACTTTPTTTHETRTVSGIVTDDHGAPLPGVTVTLHKANGDLTTYTDTAGNYTFRNVPAGKYKVDVELPGFGKQQIALDARKDVQKKTELKMTARAETITVTAQAPLLAVAGASVGQTFAVGSPAPPPPPYRVAMNIAATEIERTPNYAHIEENGVIRTADEKTTTFSIDVDGASYSNVRRYLNANLVPPPDAVRIEEMVNYFSYNYPQPNDGRPFAVSTEVAGCPWEPKHRLVRIGIQAKSLDSWKLAPNHFTFLLDVSGSMQPPERLPLVKSAMRLLVDQLRPQDSVAIVVYAGAAGLVLPPTSDKQAILSALDRLQAGGSTAGGQGIELAYKTALDNFSREANNRVILATDGDFNVGVTDIKQLTNLIEEKRKSGVYLTCVGVGTDNLNDALMESLADKGNGNYYFLDGPGEAKKVFVTQLQGTLVTVADDVKVQLEFNPDTVADYRQIGYENRALANEDFDDDAKDAGELGSGHTVTALYEITPKATGTIATLRLRYKEPSKSASQLITNTIVDDGRSIYAASPEMQFATAIAEFGMLLRNSNHKGTATYADVLALARAMRGTDLEGYREEFLRMVESSRTIMGEQHVASR